MVDFHKNVMKPFNKPCLIILVIDTKHYKVCLNIHIKIKRLAYFFFTSAKNECR